MKFLISIFVFIFTLANICGHGANPSGANVKLLKDNLRFKTTDTKIMSGDSDDPSAVSKDAEIGSLYIQAGTGTLFQKQDSGSSILWQPLLIGPIGAGTDNCIVRWDGTGSPNIQDSIVCITDLGVMTGATQLTVDSLDLNGDVFSSSGNIVLTPTGSIKISTLTASRPLKLNATNDIISTQIDLASTNDITGILGSANGGTGLNGSAAANGNLLIGNGTGYTLAPIIGTANRVTVTNGAGSITLSSPQDIHTGASPTFLGATLSGLAASSIVKTTAGSVLTTGSVDLTSDITGLLPTANGGTGLDGSSAGNGNLLIGNGTGYSIAALTGTADQVNIVNSSGGITLSTPQNIAATSSPQFTAMNLSGLTASQFVKTDGSKNLISSSSIDLASDVTGILPAANGGTSLDGSLAANGNFLIGNGSGYSLAPITGTADQIIVTNGSGTVTLTTPQDINTTSSPTFINMDLTGYLNLAEITTPISPLAGEHRAYFKSDGNLYKVDSAGSELQIASQTAKTMYIDVHATNYQNGVVGTTSYKTIPLISTSGDVAGTISANQLSLSPGEYAITLGVGAQDGTGFVDFLIYDITNSVNFEEFLIVAYTLTVASTANWGFVTATIKIATATVFEFRTKCSIGGGGTQELSSRIKIVKF